MSAAGARVVGAMMRGEWEMRARYDPVPSVAFDEPFLAACYAATLLLRELGLVASTARVWTLVSGHPDAQTFGIVYLDRIHDDAYEDDALRWDDMADLLECAAARCFSQAAALNKSGMH